jgi:3',5'-nucleoside bisphosphate phosphatase
MHSFRIRTDLHNHSCLSPCAELTMSPARLVREASRCGIEILALTDHNSARNLPAFRTCCLGAGILPVFGLEVNTAEEVHVVCLFEELSQASEFGEYIESLLPPIDNAPHLFGDQVIVDAEENILGFYEPSLFSGADISFFDLIGQVTDAGGLAIPAHIDRNSNGAVSQLGFLPDLRYSAVESIRIPPPCSVRSHTVITGSDAHRPQDVGRRSFFITGAHRVSFSALSEALREKRTAFL